MAKVDNKKLADVLPYMGNTYMLRNWKTKMTASSWPRKRGKPKDRAQQLRNEWFALANLLARYAAPAQQRAAMLYAPRGPLYPRDYLMMAMAGRMYTITLEDGTELYPMSLINDISKDLDVIQQVRGGMMFRGQQLWEPLAPPGIDEFLVNQVDPPVPSWSGARDGLGLKSITDIEHGAVSGSTRATMGWIGTIRNDLRVYTMMPWVDYVLNREYIGTICEMDGNNIGTILAQTTPYKANGTFTSNFNHDLVDTPLLKANTKYGFLWTRTDSTPTAVIGLYNGTARTTIGFPVAQNLAWATWNDNGPTEGSTIQVTGTTGPFPINLLFRL